MKVTALKNKSRFQTLESFLSTVDENGTTKDISSRCADLDSVMYEELGMLAACFLKQYIAYIQTVIIALLCSDLKGLQAQDMATLSHWNGCNAMPPRVYPR